MKKLVISAVLLSLSGVSLASSARMTKKEYVEKWKATAIQQMVEHNIPASITLAQGILESASGNSELAVKGKNHFGIKCHGWTGKKMYMDDDRAGECFRVYKSAEQSYLDHSEFLKKYDRYAFLFSYDVTDYKAWAKGLKKAGYATSPKYPDLLIGIIEDLGLDEYDKVGQPVIPAPDLLTSADRYANKHQIMVHENRVKYIVAKKGDTFYKISKEFGLTLSQLYKYNDFDSSKDVLEEGDIIYVQPKRRRNIFKKKTVVVEQTMTLDELSQYFATNKKAIKRLNGFADDTVVSKGDVVTLR